MNKTEVTDPRLKYDQISIDTPDRFVGNKGEFRTSIVRQETGALYVEIYKGTKQIWGKLLTGHIDNAISYSLDVIESPINNKTNEQ